MKQETLTYQHNEFSMQGFYAYDDTFGAKRPGILICHDWTGHTEFVEKKAKALAELGYVGFAVDMFGHGKCGKTKEEKSALIQPMMQNRHLIVERLHAALEALKKVPVVDSTKIAVMGFCFGGLCALDLARDQNAHIQAAISFHGLLQAPENQLKNIVIKSKILVLHGFDDPMVTPDQVMAFTQEMNQAQADWQIHLYGHTMHAFTNPEANDPHFGTVYNAAADKRSWETLKQFLQEVFV